MIACHLLSCIFGGTENGDNKQNIQRQQSCLGRGCNLSFSWSAVQIRLVHFMPTEPYEGLIIHVDRRSGMRVGGWADGAQGCGLRSFSAPKVRLCSGLQQQPPEAARWCCLGIHLVTASQMAKRSLPACLFFDSKSSHQWYFLYSHFFFSFFVIFSLFHSLGKNKMLLKSNILPTLYFYLCWVWQVKTHDGKLLVLPYKPDFLKLI